MVINLMKWIEFPKRKDKVTSRGQMKPEDNALLITPACFPASSSKISSNLYGCNPHPNIDTMASLRNSPAIHWTLFPNASSQLGLRKHAFFPCSRRGVPFLVRAELTRAASTSTPQNRLGRRLVLAVGPITTWVSLFYPNSSSFAAEAKKGFLSALDRKDGYSFLYPFGWQEVVIEGQDKVFKDVIEPLESVSVNLIPTIKQDIRDLGSPQEVAEALIKKVLAPPSQKTKLVEATEHDVDGKTYYTFEFIAQAPNFTRHALGAISIGNGKFYALTTGANERRWEKMKDKLHDVIDSFTIFNV